MPPTIDHSASAFADDLVLEGSTLAKPITGKHQVATVLANASSIYETLEFTAEAQGASTTCIRHDLRSLTNGPSCRK